VSELSGPAHAAVDLFVIADRQYAALIRRCVDDVGVDPGTAIDQYKFVTLNRAPWEYGIVRVKFQAIYA